MSASHLPKGYHSATPYLVIREIERAIEYYKDVFGATELFRLTTPDGQLIHADIQIGDSPVMVACESPAWGNYGPMSPEGGNCGLVHLLVKDVDTMFARAVKGGAAVLIPVGDQFYGQRAGRLRDPFGHIWAIATHKIDLTSEEMQSRFEAFMAKMNQGA